MNPYRDESRSVRRWFERLEWPSRVQLLATVMVAQFLVAGMLLEAHHGAMACAAGGSTFFWMLPMFEGYNG